jgi:protocatechuate 3,4-dioxygenase beta subunit
MTREEDIMPGSDTGSTMRAPRLSRRRLMGGLAAGAAVGAVGLVPARAFAAACGPTPAQMTGPFYPLVAGEQDADLTRIAGASGRAAGEVIEVTGRVLGTNCEPVRDAVIEIWQANAAGRYDHPRDPSPRPLDPNFQGYARLAVDGEGRYRFTTIKPGAYPVDFGPVENWTRPPHIHFKVHQTFAPTATTQMYFAGEPLNDTDLLLQAVPAAQRADLIVGFADRRADGIARGSFDLVLAGTTPGG